jgi:hypothetical protein
VNESDPEATVEGSWLRFNVPGFDGFALVTFDTGAATSVTYAATVPVSAWYDVFAYRISAPSVARTAAAPFDLLGTGGKIERVTMDQTGSQSSGWVRLGTVSLEVGYHEVVRISNEQIGSGKTVIADAVMLQINRKLSPGATTPVRSSDDEGYLPRGVDLRGNFPNPFNPSTTIRYALSAPMHVRLEIFNILGQSIAVVAQGTKAAGVHDARWVADVPSGVYVSRLTAVPLSSWQRSEIHSSRMILER